MSQRMASSTHSCLTTSRRTPPSPPPMTSTFLGLGCEFMARWVIISWYENSSRSVAWMTLSSTKTLPWLVDSKIRTSWYLLFSWCSTFLTRRVMAWPGTVLVQGSQLTGPPCCLLTGPHLRDLTEPAICLPTQPGQQTSWIRQSDELASGTTAKASPRPTRPTLLLNECANS